MGFTKGYVHGNGGGSGGGLELALSPVGWDGIDDGADRDLGQLEHSPFFPVGYREYRIQ